MKRTTPLRAVWLLAVFVALAITGAALANSTWYWKLLKSKRASGDFALTSASKTIKHPRGLAVRFSGGGDVSGSAIVSCSRGFSIASWSRDYSDSRLHRLPMMPRAQTCDVIASGSAEGFVRVQIFKRAR